MPKYRGKKDSPVENLTEISENGDGGIAAIASQSSEQPPGVSKGATGTNNGDTGAANQDYSAQLQKILTQQSKILDGQKEIRADVNKVREDLFLEIATVNRRLETLEIAQASAHEPFSPDVTVLFANLPLLAPQETEAQLLDKVQDIFTNGLKLPGIPIVGVCRKANREGNPGVVLVELPSLDEKKQVLQAKMSLRTTAAYKNLYVRSAEGHTDRLMRLNFQTLLNHFNITRSYRFTGSGRLVPRSNTGDTQANPQAANNVGAHHQR